MVGRCEKVVTTAEKLLGGEVYHYHTKLMMKEAYTGGAHVWHQDYGYWYKNGCLFPDMITVFIAIDKCWKENGCLQVADSSIKNCTNITDTSDKDFMDPSGDKTIIAEKKENN
ncbi:ectoine dioxygenase-like [Elysia marginata]|uniref:Ectoine dioxygenase-like n=1 Tax=Elysia marginata TaxID=1093978 RepID=A0AAV4JJH5_9GAST|nr:ectoine dioxygenase-like [Elysia marginata]